MATKEVEVGFEYDEKDIKRYRSYLEACTLAKQEVDQLDKEAKLKSKKVSDCKEFLLGKPGKKFVKIGWTILRYGIVMLLGVDPVLDKAEWGMKWFQKYFDARWNIDAYRIEVNEAETLLREAKEKLSEAQQDLYSFKRVNPGIESAELPEEEGDDGKGITPVPGGKTNPPTNP